MKPIKLDSQTGTAAAALTLTPVDVIQAKGYGVLVACTVATAAVKTFLDAAVDVTANTITIASHGYYTGLKVAATTTGTLPGGLSATDYYVIRVDASTIKLSTSAANAIAGTEVDITSAAGGGTHTLTPAALAGASYKLQYSLDGITYIDSGVTNNVTVTASFLHEKVDPMFNYVQLVWAMSAGQIAYSVSTLVKEENY